MAVTIFGSTGCLRGHRLRGSFKLATPYVVANQARVTFAGRSEPVPRRTTTSGIRDALSGRLLLAIVIANGTVKQIELRRLRPHLAVGAFPCVVCAELGLLEHATSRAISRSSLVVFVGQGQGRHLLIPDLEEPDSSRLRRDRAQQRPALRGGAGLCCFNGASPRRARIGLRGTGRFLRPTDRTSTRLLEAA